MPADDTPPRRKRRWRSLVLPAVLLLTSYALLLCISSAVFRPAGPMRQEGQFRTVPGQQGVVNFPTPYRSPPNVELEMGARNATVVSECTATGFTWKNSGTDEFWNQATVRWTARGPR